MPAFFIFLRILRTIALYLGWEKPHSSRMSGGSSRDQFKAGGRITLVADHYNGESALRGDIRFCRDCRSTSAAICFEIRSSA